MFTLKFLVHRREGSYCAEVEPEVFSRGAISLSIFFTLEFLMHWREGSTLLRYAEPNAGGELTVVRNNVWGDILIGAIKFCQIDVGE